MFILDPREWWAAAWRMVEPRPERGSVGRSVEPMPRTLMDDLQRALTPAEALAEERLARLALARFMS